MEAQGESRIALARRLEARRTEIGEAIFLRVSDHWFERTGSEDPEYLEGLRAAGVAALDYAFAGIEHWGESLAPVPSETIEQARRAARVGVESETVLRRYFAGYAVLEGFVMQEAEHGVLRGKEAALREVLQIVSALTDRLVAAVGDAHRRERERCERSADSGALERETVRTEVSRTGVTGARRERIMRAIVEIVAERGCANASVGAIAARARVARPTFYTLYPGGLDDGLVAVMDHGQEQVQALVSRAFAEHEGWREGTRMALGAVLALFDSDPQLARVLMVDTLGAHRRVLEHRARIVGAFRRLIVRHIGGEVPDGASPLAAQAALASVMEIIHSWLSSAERQPLIGLLGPLLGLIVEPLAGREVAIEETRRGDELARSTLAGEVVWAPIAPAPVSSEVKQPAVLANPTARRLRECLLYLAEHPQASNREVGMGIGVVHKSQISKLLAQLEEDELAVKHSAGPGVANQWRLTAYGEEITRALAGQDSSGRDA
ncbi:MAG TPA: TetR family transcriptional regulator [Solirubrobacteraceae bacterium]